jgi:hypothetical protein
MAPTPPKNGRVSGAMPEYRARLSVSFRIASPVSIIASPF